MKNVWKITCVAMLLGATFSMSGLADHSYTNSYYPGYSHVGEYCGYGYAACAPGLFCANAGYNGVGVCRPASGHHHHGWGYPHHGHHHGGHHGGHHGHGPHHGGHHR